MSNHLVWEVSMHTRYRDAVAGVNWRGVNRLIVDPDRLEINSGIFQANGPWVFSSQDIIGFEPYKNWWRLIRGIRIIHNRPEPELPYEIVIFPFFRTCKGAIKEIESVLYAN